MNLSPARQRAPDRLGPAASAVRCRELVALLESLGFTVRRGRRGNHRIVTHAGLDDFLGTSFDCGHGRDPEVRPVYVHKLRRVIEMHAQALGERE
ncbi:MAG: type II toxin-antitoxin system HicA family toxin [Pseudomonadales bacterium]|jgi:hypothetical protein|nr:type II toxin-antitoxin system HicA family toxin [Pseudomonadales bacterium]